MTCCYVGDQCVAGLAKQYCEEGVIIEADLVGLKAALSVRLYLVALRAFARSMKDCKTGWLKLILIRSSATCRLRFVSMHCYLYYGFLILPRC